MGFFDNLRDRFSGGNNNDDYYDDDYDDGYYGDDDAQDQPSGSGLLGNTPRPEAESVSVYTRSGRPVSNNAGGPSSYEGQNLEEGSYSPSYRREDGARPSSYNDGVQKRPASKINASGQLPPYVLNATAYDDVQAVVRRVKTNQPVLLNLRDTPNDAATRILDFCYGLSFGIEGEVQQVGDSVFAILPQGIQISQADLDRLVADGDLQR
ncbi:MAG: cell division protein SepF [Coriobacteriales bacterium]|nr:cell division protein SepF [Coriobacteriales bacterium]